MSSKAFTYRHAGRFLPYTVRVFETHNDTAGDIYVGVFAQSLAAALAVGIAVVTDVLGDRDGFQVVEAEVTSLAGDEEPEYVAFEGAE